MRLARALIVVILIVSLFANFVMYVKWSGKRPIFSVNGKGVSKRDFDNFIEDRVGPQYKVDLVREMMIEQAAEKEGVLPSDAEVKDLLDEDRQSDWLFDFKAQQQPWQVIDAQRQLKLNLALKRLLTKGIQVLPEQIQEEYNRQPSAYDEPNKAQVQLAAVLDPSQTQNVKDLLDKQISPTVIMRQLTPKVVVFLGDDYKLVLKQPYGTKVNSEIFSMKPNQVKDIPPDQSLASVGAKRVVVRLIQITPGHKADLNDPKVKEKISTNVAMQRAVPVSEMLSKLWADANFTSEDPNDKRMIERVLFPQRAMTDTASAH